MCELWHNKNLILGGKLSKPSREEGAGLLSDVANTATELFISKGIPYLAKRGVDAGRLRFWGNERPCVTKESHKLWHEKSSACDCKSWRELINQLSTKFRPNKRYKIDRADLDGTGFDIHSAIGKLPPPKRGWTIPGHNYTGPFNPLTNVLFPFWLLISD